MFHILLAQCHADYWLTTKIKFDLGGGLLLAKGDKLWHHRWSCRWTVYIHDGPGGLFAVVHNLRGLLGGRPATREIPKQKITVMAMFTTMQIAPLCI